MAASKPTAVHFFLVFFVMTTLILSLVCYLTGKEYAGAVRAEKTASDAASQATNALTTAEGEISALKTRLGYEFENIGVGAEPPASSVLGTLQSDLASFGREQALPTVKEATVANTLQSMRTALDSASAQVTDLQSSLKDAESRLAQQTAESRNQSQQIQESQEMSEGDLQKLVTERDELLAEKDTEIAKWRDEYRRELVEKEQVRDELERVRKELTEEIADLENVVDYLRDRIYEIENLSFEVADGEIVRVNNTTRTVWINLGSQDLLREQVSFSVYVRDHRGIGRGSEDIKAKIEVTKIRGTNLAEARIIEDDISRPIQEGDSIYSPLWGAGVKEYFSFVGIVDMDGDGESDREMLRDIIENAGSAIEIEIDDKGNRLPAGVEMSVATKFLVVGEMPSPQDFAGFDDKQAEAQKVREEHLALTKEARRQGVRLVSFNDFMNYIGYKPERRLFIAGEDRPFTLKAGARSTGTNDPIGNSRLSSGQTSSRFMKRGKKQSESSGTTSNLYK